MKRYSKRLPPHQYEHRGKRCDSFGALDYLRKQQGMGGVVLLLKRSHAAQSRKALDRLLDSDEQARLITPARYSCRQLANGVAAINDLHNITAFLNVGLVLANDIDEHEAREFIQAAILDIIAVKDRGGPRYGLNAEQRERIPPAVALVDELFCCTTLLEIATAHRKVVKALPLTGDLKAVEVEMA